MLEAILKREGLTLRAFAELVGYHGHGDISKAMRGAPERKGAKAKKPTLEHMPGWAAKLGLVGAERDRFIELAELTHAPPAIAVRYLAMQRDLAVLTGGHAPAVSPRLRTGAGEPALEELKRRLTAAEQRAAEAERRYLAERRRQT